MESQLRTETTERRLERALAAQACEDTVIRFTAHFDARECEAMESFFAEDGRWLRGAEVVEGTAGLRHMMRTRPPGLFVRHILTNLRTEFRADDHACVDSYVTAYRWDGPSTPVTPVPLTAPSVVGSFHDELRLLEGRWRIVLRQLQVDFRRES